MYTITVTAYDPGDYLHPDQRLELIEETSGKRYELYIRNDATAPPESGEISVFIPAHAIKDIQSDKEYCVITLSHAATLTEAVQRLTRLVACLNAPGAAVKPEPTTTRPRKR